MQTRTQLQFHQIRGGRRLGEARRARPPSISTDSFVSKCTAASMDSSDSAVLRSTSTVPTGPPRIATPSTPSLHFGSVRPGRGEATESEEETPDGGMSLSGIPSGRWRWRSSRDFEHTRRTDWRRFTMAHRRNHAHRIQRPPKSLNPKSRERWERGDLSFIPDVEGSPRRRGLTRVIDRTGPDQPPCDELTTTDIGDQTASSSGMMVFVPS